MLSCGSVSSWRHAYGCDDRRDVVYIKLASAASSSEGTLASLIYTISCLSPVLAVGFQPSPVASGAKPNTPLHISCCCLLVSPGSVLSHSLPHLRRSSASRSPCATNSSSSSSSRQIALTQPHSQTDQRQLTPSRPALAVLLLLAVRLQGFYPWGCLPSTRWMTPGLSTTVR